MMVHSMMQHTRKTLAVVALLATVFFTAGPGAEVVKKVAVLPFQINAAEDYSYLRDGILDMLASRLAWEGKVVVIEKQVVKEAIAGHQGQLNEPFAREVGQSLGADYVLFGSLTIFGDSVSIDSKMVPLTADKQPVTVYAQTKGMDGVIPRINDFAQEVNSKIFGRRPTEVAAAPQQPRFSQAHPERMLYSGTVPAGPAPPGAIPAQPQQQTSPLNPYFVVPSSTTYSGGIWQSQQLELAITSMAVADVNKDTFKEIILLSPGELHIYQQTPTSLRLIKTHKGNSWDHFVWVTAADLNGNGIAEIYVSNRRRQAVMASFVLEWNGSDWVEIADSIYYHLRAANLPSQGAVLLGQSGDQDQPFSGGVFILNREGENYRPITGVPIPRGANIYSFAMADLTQDGNIENLIVDKSGAFLMEDGTGNLLWESEDRFAASFDFMLGEDFDPTLRGSVDSNASAQSRTDTVSTREKVYLNAPILVVDLNGDERPEAIINKNISGLLGRKFLDINFFGKSELHSMSWNGMTMVTDWHTPAFQGMTTAYELADMNGDGAEELLVALVNSPGTSIWSSAKSKVVVYPIAVPEGGQKVSEQQ
jgi:TolB-like protein